MQRLEGADVFLAFAQLDLEIVRPRLAQIVAPLLIEALHLRLFVEREIDQITVGIGKLPAHGKTEFGQHLCFLRVAFRIGARNDGEEMTAANAIFVHQRANRGAIGRDVGGCILAPPERPEAEEGEPALEARKLDDGDARAGDHFVMPPQQQMTDALAPLPG